MYQSQETMSGERLDDLPWMLKAERTIWLTISECRATPSNVPFVGGQVVAFIVAWNSCTERYVPRGDLGL